MAEKLDLYKQVMNYLKQAMPDTFKYDRTPPIGTNPPGLFPQPPVKPIEKILPVQGGGDGFSVYNPDPNRTRNESNYNARAYMKANPSEFFDLNNPNEMRGLDPKQLKGIPGAIQGYLKNSFVGKGLGALGNMMPVNQRAILENELLGQGFQLNDIGQFVSDGGDINKADGSNIMAGYNANKVTRQTFEKRRKMIEDNMKDPKQKAAKLAALKAAEDKFFGGSAKATTVFNDKLKQKDIDDGFINDQIPTYDEEIKTSTYSEDEEDNILDDILDYTNKNIYNTKNIYTSVPESTYDEEIFDPGDGTGTTGSVDPAGINTIDSTVYANEDNPNSVSTSGLTYNQGGGQDGSYDFVEQNFGNPGGNYNAGQAAENAQRAAIRDAAKTGMTVNEAKASVGMPANLGDTGGGDNQSNAGKIVCTMMNEFYGFGSFRNKIWMKFHKDLSPEYQKGYHKLFLPLVRIAKTNKVVRKILEHIAVHSTIDMRQATRGKMHLLGRIYRKILLPLCYIVGKHG